MRAFLGYLIPILLFILLLVAIFAIGFAMVTGFAALMGWLLRRVFELTVAESLFLGGFFSALAVAFIHWLLNLFGPSNGLPTPYGQGSDDRIAVEDEPDYKNIAKNRFYKTPSERTWEAWLRYEFANDIYMELQSEPSTISHMNDSQAQELSIRLADVAITMLKRRNSRSKNLEVNELTLKREMVRLGQRAYDDDILEAAVMAVNLNLEYYQDEILDLLRTRRWDSLAPSEHDDEDD
jgi:hypothetical protein